MKKQLLAIVFVCITSISWGQINEIGVFIGGTNYVGDVGSTNYIYPNKIGGSLVYKYNTNPRIAFRGMLSLLPISGDDAKATNEIRQNRNFNFQNSLKELAIGIEYNFFEYDMTSDDKYYTPYIHVGVSGVLYQHVASEITTGQYNFTSKSTISIPFGLGFKGRLFYNVGFAFETKVNYTFVDELDFTTNRIPSLNFGGNSNDWYMFTGVSIVYAFGRPACYAELR
ncbi:MAG: hypothetical protein HWD85_09925 [Flavobacteriaceae bacterium]|nr:hypothetical protein [Flavobacteriaceae bacterium]